MDNYNFHMYLMYNCITIWAREKERERERERDIGFNNTIRYHMISDPHNCKTDLLFWQGLLGGFAPIASPARSCCMAVGIIIYKCVNHL